MFTKSMVLGITLIELLIGLAIVVILSTASIPSFMSLIKNHRLTAVAEDFYYNLQYARSEALKQNTQIYVSFVTGDNWCYGMKAGSSCNCTIAGDCTLGAVSASSSQQISLSAIGYAGNNITFEGSHGAANNSGSITFTLYQGSTLITLSIGKLGNIQMCSTGINGYTPC